MGPHIAGKGEPLNPALLKFALPFIALQHRPPRNRRQTSQDFDTGSQNMQSSAEIVDKNKEECRGLPTSTDSAPIGSAQAQPNFSLCTV